MSPSEEDEDTRPAPRIHAPRQARSRESLSRLLDAAQAILAEGGLEAATVPAIAARAGLSVGAVYRRFADKDALLRAVYDRVHERYREMNEGELDPAALGGIPLAALIRGMMHALVRVYSEQRTLMQAMLRYAETHQDPLFRRRAAEVNLRGVERFTALIAARRGELTHPDAESAARFALLTVGLVLRGVVLSEQTVPGMSLAPGVALEEELTRMVLGYLGVRPETGSSGLA